MNAMLATHSREARTLRPQLVLTTKGTPPPASDDPVVAAAGDIAGSITDSAGTAALLDGLAPDRVLTLGDHAYPDGTLSQFQAYYDPNWGRHKFRTSPTPGLPSALW